MILFVLFTVKTVVFCNKSSRNTIQKYCTTVHDRSIGRISFNAPTTQRGRWIKNTSTTSMNRRRVCRWSLFLRILFFSSFVIKENTLVVDSIQLGPIEIKANIANRSQNEIIANRRIIILRLPIRLFVDLVVSCIPDFLACGRYFYSFTKLTGFDNESIWYIHQPKC